MITVGRMGFTQPSGLLTSQGSGHVLSQRARCPHDINDGRRRIGRLPGRKELIVPQVRGEGVLVGLADIPWGDLSHAYGPAGDVPGLLRAIASGDAKAAGDAVLELFGNIWHQGTVYQATPCAVPFLARMAAAGIRADDLVQLLGCIAESADDATGGRVRAAVAAEAGLLIPLLRDADPGIRAGTAWALAQCRAGDEACGGAGAVGCRGESGSPRDDVEGDVGTRARAGPSLHCPGRGVRGQRG